MYRLPKLLLAVLCSLGFLSSAAAPVAAQDSDSRHTLAVSGEAEVSVVPDMAVVRFGIVNEAEEATEARRRNGELAAQAMNAVRELGIEERKIQLQALSLQPKRERDPETRQMREVGYEATRMVAVEVMDLEQLPELIALVVEQGANRLRGIQYDLSDRTEAEHDALRQAIEAAQAKADVMASALGVTRGPALSAQEQSFNFVRPQPQFARQGMMEQMADAVQPDAFAEGEIEVRATVQIVFRMD